MDEGLQYVAKEASIGVNVERIVCSLLNLDPPPYFEGKVCLLHPQGRHMLHYSLITANHTSASMGRQERNKANIQKSSKKGQVADRGIQ